MALMQKHMIVIPQGAIGRQPLDSCVLVQWRHRPNIDIGNRIRILHVYRKLHHKIIASITWLSSSALLVRISKKLDRSSFSWNRCGEMPYCCNGRLERLGKKGESSLSGQWSKSRILKIKTALMQQSWSRAHGKT